MDIDNNHTYAYNIQIRCATESLTDDQSLRLSRISTHSTEAEGLLCLHYNKSNTKYSKMVLRSVPHICYNSNGVHNVMTCLESIQTNALLHVTRTQTIIVSECMIHITDTLQ